MIESKIAELKKTIADLESGKESAYPWGLELAKEIEFFLKTKNGTVYEIVNGKIISSKPLAECIGKHV